MSYLWRSLYLFIAIAALLGCSHASLYGGEPGGTAKQSRLFDPALYSGGDGSSREKAVVLMSRSEARGVGSEYEWLNHKFPGCKPERQALTPWNDQGKLYDIIEVRKANGELITVYFDISNMYK